jgi:hypothetical protein
MNLQLDLLNNFDMASSFVSLHRQFKKKGSFVSFSPRLKQERNQSILPHSARGVHVE